MKHLASLALLLTFAAAQVALAEDQNPQNQQAQQKKKPPVHRQGNTSGVTTRNPQTFRNPSTNPNYHPNTGVYNPNFRVQTRRRDLITPNHQITIGDRNISNSANAVNNAQNWKNNPNWKGNQNWKGNPDLKKNTNWKSNNWWKTNPNWQANHAKWAHYHKWDRVRRDRSWWTSHYSRFATFGGGYYYLNNGFWYPAYGYDPSFSTYSYDAPIYAYNNQEPGEVVADVQNALAQAGYDPGAIDNTYGPQTRDALLSYQSDNGLPESGEIDEATLASLGLE